MFDKEQTLDLRVLGKNSSNENSWWQQHPDDERSHLNEECGLFGVWGHPDAARRPILDFMLSNIAGKKAQGFWSIIMANSIVIVVWVWSQKFSVTKKIWKS